MKAERDINLLTYDQLAQALQVNRGTLRNWVSEGYVPHIKMRRSVRFDPGQIDLWLRKQGKEGRLDKRVV